MSRSKTKLTFPAQTMKKIRYYEDTMVDVYNKDQNPAFNIDATPYQGKCT